jgi:hypothetical protein
MKSKLLNPYGLRLFAAVLTAALLAGCSSSSTRSMGQKIGDRQVSRAVTKGLNADPTFKYNDVQANVYDGNVQLTGFVETPEQRLRAAEVASRTKGAKQVINEIMIKPKLAGPATIRDPLGNEDGQMLVDTNSPPALLRNLPASGAATEPAGQGTSGTSSQGTNPK